MTTRPLPARVADYREKAMETRARAHAEAGKETRESLLKDAKMWEGLASWLENRDFGLSQFPRVLELEALRITLWNRRFSPRPSKMVWASSQRRGASSARCVAPRSHERELGDADCTYAVLGNHRYFGQTTAAVAWRHRCRIQGRRDSPCPYCLPRGFRHLTSSFEVA